MSFAFGVAALGNDAVAPSSAAPWSPARLGKYESDLAIEASRDKLGSDKVRIDPEKVYDLPELIDIAQRNNPETRVAWERAREAAAAVGISASTYYPYLAASAGAGAERTIIPIPVENPVTARLVGKTLPIRDHQLDVALSVKWLLIDFGQRGAIVDAAKQQLMMANVGFNATHQKIVFEVTRDFYELGNARQQVAVAASALRAAQTVEQAVKARLENGLAIKPEYLQAQQQTAQFGYELEAATGAESDAQVALIDSLGILPTTQLQIADYGNKPLPAAPQESVDALIDLALSQRPDLVIKLANLRAKQAEVRAARADYYPKVSVSAEAARVGYQVSVDASLYNGKDHTTDGVMLNVELPLFDGFLRLKKLRAAEADLRAAESELADSRDSAVRDVWKSYTDFRTALREQDAAAKLLTAAENAYAAVLESYRNGLSTYPEVVNAERDVISARSVGHNTRASIFTHAASLALSIGELAKPPLPTPPQPPQPPPRANHETNR